LRESAAVRVAQRLALDGCEVLIHDPRVFMDKLIGANKQFVETQIPDLARMMRSTAEEVLEKAELLIVVAPDFDWARGAKTLRENQTIIDVDGGGKAVMKEDPRYVGICW
jgi:GDP-mannose 6-dehydrogenase